MQGLADLGNQLAARRKELRLTQAQAGARMGLRQEEVSQLERGRLPGLSLGRLLKAVSALGLALCLVPEVPRAPTLEDLLRDVEAGEATGPDAR